MSRDGELLAALTSAPATTEELYERVGYRALVRLGLVPYGAFRDALERLAAAGLAERIDGDPDEDRPTRWRLPASGPA